MSLDAAPDGGAGTPAADPAEDPVRLAIRAAVREGRQAKGLTQEKLGKEIEVSRFVINRIEAGLIDPTPEVAEHLDSVLGGTRLRALVAQRDRAVAPTATGRDEVVSRILSTPGLRRVRIVLADWLNLYPRVFTRGADDDLVLRCPDIEIVVPSITRERELFGEHSSLHGHVEYQLKRLLDLKKSDRYGADTLRLYESDGVTSCLVVAESATGVEAAVWSPLGVRTGLPDTVAATLPVGVTTDPKVVAHLENHVQGLVAGLEPLRSNEALCRVDTGTTPPSVRFTRYFTVGEDQEEDVADTEGIAVALVLLVALCPRGSHGIDRRVITYLRRSARMDRRRSLFSTNVEDLDLRRSREVAEGLPPAVEERRSTKTALVSAMDLNGFMEANGQSIPDSAFQFAAAREMSIFDLDVDPERFRPHELPPELRLIRKSAGRAAIAPRLFVLELLGDTADPELQVLQSKAAVEEVGRADLAEDPDLNDFLSSARDLGFLDELLSELRVAQR